MALLVASCVPAEPRGEGAVQGGLVQSPSVPVATALPPARRGATAQVAVDPPDARDRQMVASGHTWSSEARPEVNLGRLDCYSQDELDGCSARKQRAPSDPCERPGDTLVVVVEAGMNCKDCFKDCYCRAIVATYTCH